MCEDYSLESSEKYVLPVPHHLPKFAQIHAHCISEAIQSSHSLMPSSPFALNLSCIRDFSKELAVCIRWPKHWSFSISPSKEYSELISLKIDWFDLLAVQGTLRSLLQHHSSILFNWYFLITYISLLRDPTCLLNMPMFPFKYLNMFIVTI